ncbi:hypothetical protein JCM19238_5238 [Vibrio ponticus]|nr:hypothetical protein JCM19238_5238 [Vibrio ponticus]
MELDAKYQTGIGLISGLFDTQQIDLAEELLARLENDSWDYKQQLGIDRWAFRIAGAQYLHTNYALGGSMAVEQQWLKNPHLIEAVDYNQDKLADYLSLIDASKQLSFDELLTAFYALGVIRPYSLDKQQARYAKLQQLLLDKLKQDEWRTLRASQQIEILALYSSYTAHNSILNHLAAQDYLKPLPDEIDRELTRLLTQRDQYSLSELSQIRYIATRSKDEQVVLARSEIEQLLTSQTDRKPTEFLTMAKTASMVLTSFDYRENQQLIQQYQADLIEQFTGHSAGMLEAVNKQMMNALELGMVTKAQELSLLSVHPSVSQNPQYNQSGLLQAEILIALYQRDMPPIADFAEQFMQFEQRRFQYYLDYVGEVSETIKRSYFGSEYPLMLAASNKDWSAMDKIAKQQQLSSFGWRAFISYLYQIGGQPERAMAILGDVASWHDFTDTPMWLAEDVKNEVIFLYGRKKPGAASEALSSLKRYAEIEQYEQQTDSYHAAKNYLFQYGLALRSRSDINEINRIKDWLQSSTGLSELPASYQSYYQKLLSLDE